MRIALEAVIVAVAFFAVMWVININQQYADMVASQNAPKLVSIKFNSSTASVKCVMKGEVCDARR